MAIRKFWKVSLMVFGGIVLTLGLLSLILGLIPANAGVETDAQPFGVTVSKEGYVETIGTEPNFKSYSDLDGQLFTDLTKEYSKMTDYSVLRGVLEGKGAPKAKIESNTLKADDINKISEAPAPAQPETEGENTEEQKPVATATRYFVTVKYQEKQSVTLKKTDKDDKEKYTVEYDRVVFAVSESNLITTVRAYVFIAEDFSKEDFQAASIWITANQMGMFQLCDSCFKK